MSNFDLVLRLFLQLATILGACRLVAFVLKRLGQTTVVGEMVAGMLLGPSLLGLVSPAAEAWLFPKAPLVLATGETAANPSMSILSAVSQIGLALYMFLVGAELDLGLLRKDARRAAAVSVSGIVAPFILGAIASVPLVRRSFADVPLFAEGVRPIEAALFLGAAMSITAFPMLARILYERGLAKSRLGVLTLAAGASDDVIAWSLLAVVLAYTQHDGRVAAITIGGAVLYTVLVHRVLRPLLLAKLARSVERAGTAPHAVLVLVLALVFGGAWITDRLGVHAVFGAFVLGTAIPRGVLTRELFEKLEPVTTTVLVPVFFAYAGLNASVGLLDSGALWAITGLLSLVAIVGKFGACTVAARASGESWRDSVTIGTLMNTRGMMGLIILNIGLERGVLSPTLYAMLVLVAVGTTLATSPAVALLLRGRVTKSVPDAREA